MRRKALEFLGKLHSSDKITYGFKSRNYPPIVHELENFENELLFLIKNIQFRKVNNNFQSQLNEGIKQIKGDSKIFVPADKSRNIYKMDKETYEKLLHENITKTYKKTGKKRVRAINVDAKKIATHLELEDRIEKMQESECYITVKDHKEDFPHKISCRLINPSKSDIRRLSKIILDKINSDVLSSVQVNQWKNSQAVVEWFKNI